MLQKILRSKNLVVATFLYLMPLAYFILTSVIDNDELEHLHASWLVHLGQLPFTDFVEQHNHTLWYLFAGLVGSFVDRFYPLFVLVRCIDFGFLLIAAFFAYRLFGLFFDKTIRLILLAILLASVTFVNNMILFRPDPLMTALLMMSFYFWGSYFKNPKHISAILCGLTLGLAIVVLQKALSFGLMMGGLFFLAAAFRKRFGYTKKSIWIDFCLFTFFSATPIALFLVWTNQILNFSDYWFWNFTFNSFFYLKAHVFHHFPWYMMLLRSLQENFAPWLIGVAGFILILKKERRDFALLSLATMTLCYFLAFTQNRFPLSQYLLPFFPLAILCGGVFIQYLLQHRQAWMRRLPFVLVGLSFLEYSLLFIFYKKNDERVQGIEYILKHTTPDDTVFIQPPFHPVFRKDATFFWYNNGPIIKALTDFQTNHSAKNKIVEQAQKWQARPPALVRYDPDYEYKFFPETKILFQGYKPIGLFKLYAPAEADHPF